MVQERDHTRRLARGKRAYKPGDQHPAELDIVFRHQTPRIGLWLDTSAQTVTDTIEEILDRFQAEAEVRTSPPAPATPRTPRPGDPPRSCGRENQIRSRHTLARLA